MPLTPKEMIKLLNRNKLLNGADGPLSYDGEPIPKDDAELLLGQR